MAQAVLMGEWVCVCMYVHTCVSRQAAIEGNSSREPHSAQSGCRVYATDRPGPILPQDRQHPQVRALPVVQPLKFENGNEISRNM